MTDQTQTESTTETVIESPAEQAKRIRVTKHEVALQKSLCGTAVQFKQLAGLKGNLRFVRSEQVRYARALFSLVLSRKGEADVMYVDGLTFNEAKIFIAGMATVATAVSVKGAIEAIVEPTAVAA